MPAGLTETIVAFQSKWLSNEKVQPGSTFYNSLSPELRWHNSKIRVEFKGSCLKQDKVTFMPKNKVNLLTVYELGTWSQHLSANFTPENCLFGVVKLNKCTDSDKYSFSGYGI